MEGVESSNENCLGWAARDSSGILSPYRFTRRLVFPQILFSHVYFFLLTLDRSERA